MNLDFEELAKKNGWRICRQPEKRPDSITVILKVCKDPDVEESISMPEKNREGTAERLLKRKMRMDAKRKKVRMRKAEEIKREQDAFMPLAPKFYWTEPLPAHAADAPVVPIEDVHRSWPRGRFLSPWDGNNTAEMTEQMYQGTYNLNLI